MSSIGFIGCGNMGGTLALAVSKSSYEGEIFLTNHNEEKAARIIAQSGSKNIKVVSNEVIARECKFIVLGVKPQVMADTLDSIKDILAQRADRFVLVTMAAGKTTAFISEAAGGDYPVIRIMPNTPSMLGCGVILYCVNDLVLEAEAEEFVGAFSKAGMIDLIDESIMDAASAVSGCGPAFVYMFIEAMANGGVENGLSREKATEYAAQTALGAARMVLETGKTPETLKIEVCSPKGSTLEGVGVLDNRGFSDTVKDAVGASFRRTKELAQN